MPDMFERVYSFLEDANLFNGTGGSDNWIPQKEVWLDSGNGWDKFMVLQSGGGTQVRQGLANDFYFSLYIVGQHDVNNIEESKSKAIEVIDYIKENPLDSCLNYIQMQQPLPRPVLTEEKRIVYELMLRVVCGC